MDTDLWDLNPRDQSANVAPQFDKNWAPLLKAANLQSRAEKRESKIPPSLKESDTFIFIGLPPIHRVGPQGENHINMDSSISEGT